MFEAPPASATRPRPMFAFSAAAHLALVAVLVVPPLLATPETPELDDFVRIESIPVLVRDEPARGKEILLRKEKILGGARPAVVRTTRFMLPQSAPGPLTELLPAPTGEELQGSGRGASPST